MPKLHQQSPLRRVNVEMMLISMIGSRSTSARIADRMASGTKYPSANYDLYRAYTSLLLLLSPRIAILINCKIAASSAAAESFPRLTLAGEWKKVFIAKPTDFCQLSL